MDLTPGGKLGPYELVAAIGKGGMGEVWRAGDPRLGRDVAIKVSAQQFTDRFEREARAIAALNHSNVCTLYDVGPNYLVMELVEGPTLAERIARGPVPIGEALPIARQIADALDAAHEKGITHRDLKPANIKIRPDGSVKVLDFGLAKTGETPELSPDSPTMMSIPGMILGTAAYMSPEQAAGQPVDKRADVWAFGVVLYEMLTAKRLFQGDSLAHVLADVLRAPIDLTTLPKDTPRRIRNLMKRCLDRDLKTRLRDIREARVVIDAADEPELAPLLDAPAQSSWVPWAVAALGLLAAVGLGLAHFHERPADDRPIVSTISFPENSVPGFLAFSPDGSRLIVRLSTAGKTQLFLRSLDSPQLQPLTPETGNVRAPFWSPDSKFIGFFADGKLRTMPASGGPPQDLCDVGSEAGGAWNRDGVILFGINQGPLFRVNAEGGPCTQVTRPAPGSSTSFPEFLPDGKHFFYFAGNPDLSKRGTYLATLDDPNGSRLLADNSSVIYTPPAPGARYGHLLFLRDGKTLMAQAFDGGRLQLAGDPVVVTDPASASQDNISPDASASANGTLAFVANKAPESQLVWFDRVGKQLAKVGPRSGPPLSVALSPTGKTVAIHRTAGGRLSLLDLARESESPIADASTAAIWSPDGNSIIYARGNDLYRKEVAGGGDETPLLRGGTDARAPSGLSGDGRFLLYTEVDSKSQGDIWYLPNPLGKDPPGKPGGQAVKFLGTNANESEAQLSPDGRWVAYCSDEAGNYGDIYIRPFPAGSGKWKVSTNGGVDPRWSADGKEIYFYLGGNLTAAIWAATVRPGRDGMLEIGVPQKLFDYRGNFARREFNDFSYSPASGGRFLVGAFVDAAPPPTINLIQNWWKLAGARQP